MKNIFAFILVLISSSSFGQDTTIVYNNFKYKCGANFNINYSNDYSLVPDGSTVVSGGFQVVRKFKKSKSSIESGIYLMSKAVGQSYDYNRVVYRNLDIPINYRYDTKVIYISVGIYLDYLLWKEYNQLPPSYMPDRILNIGYNLTLGIEKPINKHLNLLIDGHILNNITHSKPDYKLFAPSYTNYGFAIGINYKLLK